MKKIVLLAVSVIILASCGSGASEKEKLQVKNDSLALELSTRNAELDEMMATFNAVQDGFRQINQAEDRINVQTEGDANASLASRMMDDIQFITNKMAENKEKIAQLQLQLRRSKSQSSQFRKAIQALKEELKAKTVKIEELQAELARKNVRIHELDQAVTSLNANVEELKASHQEQQKIVAAQDRAINTAWFVFGTKSELKDQNILKHGDVLKTADFNKDYFTEVDIRKMKELKLYAKRAYLLTTHPAGSYNLIKDDKKQMVLEITNSAEFWSVSRYLVIRVR